ncbi:unnamed protein product [Agarophyton chilense]
MWDARGIGPRVMLRTAEELSQRILKLYASVVDVASNHVRYNALRSSPHFQQYLAAACKLRYFNPALLPESHRKAFFLNVYNSLIIHALAVMSPPRTKFERISLFNTAAYNIGGRVYSLNMIEHGILRANHPGAGPFALRVFAHNDPRLQCALSRVDPRIHFALNCGARSCPAVRFYNPHNLDATLHTATTTYLQDVDVDLQLRTVTLPKLFQWYKRDFSPDASQHQLVEWTLQYLSPEKRTQVESLLQDNKQRSLPLKLLFADYDWSLNDTSPAT